MKENPSKFLKLMYKYSILLMAAVKDVRGDLDAYERLIILCIIKQKVLAIYNDFM